MVLFFLIMLVVFEYREVILGTLVILLLLKYLLKRK